MVEQKKKFPVSGFQDMPESLKGDQCCDWCWKEVRRLFWRSQLLFLKKQWPPCSSSVVRYIIGSDWRNHGVQKSGNDCRQENLRPKQFWCPDACLSLTLLSSLPLFRTLFCSMSMLYRGLCWYHQGLWPFSHGTITKGHCTPRALSTASFTVPPECPPLSNIYWWHLMGRGSHGRLSGLCFCQEP